MTDEILSGVNVSSGHDCFGGYLGSFTEKVR